MHAAAAAQQDSITLFTSCLQENDINDTTAMKLRLCCVLNFWNSWAKGSPSLTWKSSNYCIHYCSYWIIAGRLINNITLLALKCFCTRWDGSNNGQHFDKMRSSFDPRHHIWPSEIICQIACKFRQRRQRLIKFKKSKLALLITFGWECRSTPQFRNEFRIRNIHQRLGNNQTTNKWQIFLPHEDSRVTWRMGGQSAGMATVKLQRQKNSTPPTNHL
jgi:hypothetical protein